MTFPVVRFLFGFALIATLLGCRAGTDPAPPSADYDFAPLETGRYVTYAVTEQRYSLAAPPQTLTYQLKETIGATFTDATKRPAYQLLRSRRNRATQPWVVDSVWAVQRADDALLRTENGRTFVSLLFPVLPDSRWNGNILNNAPADTYQTAALNQPFRVEGKDFSQTVTVVQQADSTLVGLRKGRSIWARGVGLIYREATQVQYCTSTPACVGRQQIDFGRVVTWRVIEYGKE